MNTLQIKVVQPPDVGPLVVNHGSSRMQLPNMGLSVVFLQNAHGTAT